MSAYGYVEPRIAEFSRVCATHETPLLEQRCAYRHGNGYTCERWYLTRDGIVEAEVTAYKVRWLRGSPDDEDGPESGRRLLKIRCHPKVREKQDPAVRLARRREESRRHKERARAAREGREPAEWAQKRSA